MTTPTPPAAPPSELPPVARWIALAAFTVLVVVGVLAQGADPLRIAAAVVAVAALALVQDGRATAVQLPAAGAALAAVAVICNGSSSNVGWFAVVVLTGWLASVAAVHVWMVVWIAALATLGGEWLTVDDRGWAPWMAGTSFGVIACWFARRDRTLVARLRAAQQGLAERARAEERNRIAREVHDVVAHSLTVSLLHISSARLALDDDPADADRVLAEAERLGRAALGEVRQAVGMLRQDEASSTAPLPGAGQLGELVETVRAAGAPVTMDADGDLHTIPATTGVTLYRILQESLTNAMRHAPAAPTTVRVRVLDGHVVLDVATALSAVRPMSGTGTGLHSMRERAEALGGTCTAGPDGAGWLVHADLPVHAVDPSPRPAPTALPAS